MPSPVLSSASFQRASLACMAAWASLRSVMSCSTVVRLTSRPCSQVLVPLEYTQIGRPVAVTMANSIAWSPDWSASMAYKALMARSASGVKNRWVEARVLGWNAWGEVSKIGYTPSVHATRSRTRSISQPPMRASDCAALNNWLRDSRAASACT